MEQAVLILGERGMGLALACSAQEAPWQTA